jgi:hypothetical protein
MRNVPSLRSSLAFMAAFTALLMSSRSIAKSSSFRKESLI